VIVARTRSEGELLVIFSRDGENDDARLIPNGERAAVATVLMITTRGTLHAGDQRTVTRSDAGDEARR
jgi:hypothetical protein